jgi:pimeloyl-ACP methyl ester carboxylesterase
VHRGFREALDLVWDDVARALGGRPCRFAGHSLGAALATLAAARYPAVGPLYTFGSPRVGDAAFAESVRVPCYRFVNNSDFVTGLPPPVRYRHVGELVHFDERGVLRREPDLGTRLKAGLRGFSARARENVAAWFQGDLARVPFDSVVAHSPLHYAVRCWNHLVSGTSRRGRGA